MHAVEINNSEHGASSEQTRSLLFAYADFEVVVGCNVFQLKREKYFVTGKCGQNHKAECVACFPVCACKSRPTYGLLWYVCNGIISLWMTIFKPVILYIVIVYVSCWHNTRFYDYFKNLQFTVFPVTIPVVC